MVDESIVKCNECGTKNRINDNSPKNKKIICGKCSKPLSPSLERQKILNKIKEELKRVRNYTPKVGIFGDTGVGKSSLCNALFGKDIAKISNVEACTRKPQEILIGDSDGKGIILVDVPGVGEDRQRNNEYFKLYKSLSKELDLIIWAIKADDRKYMTAIDAYQEILLPNLKNCPVIFVITQVDKIEPYREWNRKENLPSPKQLENIVRKTDDIASRFSVDKNTIIPISANDSYNLVKLVNKIVEVLPNEKKYSFTRETKKEIVSDEASENAEKGIWTHVKEMAGTAWDYIKDEVLDEAVKIILKVVPKPVVVVLKWLGIIS